MKIGVIDYGVGNLGSIQSAFELLGIDVGMITSATALSGQDALILPGVGSFADCAGRLTEGQWMGALREQVIERNTPLLGICVGMQLLATTGFEGADHAAGIAGFGFVPGTVEHLGTRGCGQRLPHVGWNAVMHGGSSPLFKGIPSGTDFYFTHSYALFSDAADCVTGSAEYEIRFPVAVAAGHVFGVQFHPEKSSKAGLQLLRNFADLARC